jgi:fructose-1,6-bisphosphatase/inositol monophosphatase family enzyme
MLTCSKREVSHAFLELYTNETSAEGQALWRNIEATGAYIVRYAATGFTMVSVARGSSEALVSVRNPSSYEWDVAPGALLIQEAGGTVRSWDGEAQVFDSRKPNFIVANQVAYSALERLVDQSMSSTPSSMFPS